MRLEIISKEQHHYMAYMVSIVSMQIILLLSQSYYYALIVGKITEASDFEDFAESQQQEIKEKFELIKFEYSLMNPSSKRINRYFEVLFIPPAGVQTVYHPSIIHQQNRSTLTIQYNIPDILLDIKKLFKFEYENAGWSDVHPALAAYWRSLENINRSRPIPNSETIEIAIPFDGEIYDYQAESTDDVRIVKVTIKEKEMTTLQPLQFKSTSSSSSSKDIESKVGP
jgi:hypothetical protein